MSNIKQIKTRIKTASNIKKITKAMEMVSASKMRRAQDRTLSSQPYTDKLYQILANLEGRIDPQSHPLLQEKDQGQVAIVLLSTDKGLCGPYNTNLFRYLDDWLKAQSISQPLFISAGRKGGTYLVKTQQNLEAEFPAFTDHASYQDTLSLSQLALEGFLKGQFRQVYLGYMHFVNTLNQKPRLEKLLPITQLFNNTTATFTENSHQPIPSKEYLFEPSIQEILDWLLPYYVELKIYQAVLNSLASEHSARMVTMKNAHDNASDITDSLTLEYNRARQSRITNELLDVVTARTALGE